jgi:hypothetical protein
MLVQGCGGSLTGSSVPPYAPTRIHCNLSPDRNFHHPHFTECFTGFISRGDEAGIGWPGALDRSAAPFSRRSRSYAHEAGAWRVFRLYYFAMSKASGGSKGVSFHDC